MADLSNSRQPFSSHVEEQVEFTHYYQPGDTQLDPYLADAADDDTDFPGLADLVNEVIAGDVRNLDEFSDSVLCGVPQSGDEVQGTTPIEIDYPVLTPSPDDNEVKSDSETVIIPETKTTPVVVLDGQLLPLQIPQQNGVFTITPQGVQLITFPLQNTLVAVTPQPVSAPTTLAARNNDTDARVTSLVTTQSGSKRKAQEDSNSKAGSKKRKLYEAAAFSDPVMEKKRLNAVNAKNHRERTKHTIDSLAEKVDKLNKENDQLRKENEDLKKKLGKVLQHYQQEQFVQQLQKCGVQDMDISDLLH